MDGDQKTAPAEVAAGAASMEVAADAYPAKNQYPEADGGPNDNVGLARTDPVAPPMSVGELQPGSPSQSAAGPDEGYPIQVGQCDYFFFKAVKEDKQLAPSCGRWSVSSKV